MSTVKPHRLFAAVYDRQLRPVERRWLGRSRAALAGELTGEVLEVGAGTGANLANYQHATSVVACEPDPAMRARLARKLPAARVPVELCDASTEALPLADQRFDAVAGPAHAAAGLEVFRPKPNSPLTQPFIQGTATRSIASCGGGDQLDARRR